jgi:hypothetical protein
MGRVEVPAVQADDQRQVRSGQLGPVPRAALDEGELLVSELVFQALGYRPGVVADRGGVQRPAQGSSSASRVAEVP